MFYNLIRLCALITLTLISSSWAKETTKDTTPPPAAEPQKGEPQPSADSNSQEIPDTSKSDTPPNSQESPDTSTADASPADNTAEASAPPPTLPHRPPSGSVNQRPEGIENISKELFVYMPPLDITIIKDGQHQGYLGITVIWQAVDKDAAEELKASIPRLRDVIITDLHSALYLLWRPGFLPDKKFVMRRLELSAEKIIKGEKIAHVYTKDFYVKEKPGR